MLETITLTEVTDVVTPEEETTPENYNFAMESTWEETTYSQGGGGGVTPEGSIDISENGTYDVTDYAEAVVDVSNSYTASDEGKVVDNGALVAQTSKNVTSNGTVDTTLNNEVVVNVPTGITPTGTKNISITQNGTTTEDVTDYASAEITVNVPASGFSLDTFATTGVTGDVTLSTTTTIRNNAFLNEPLTSISSTTVKTTKESAISGCTSLTSFNFPNLTGLGNKTFSGDTKLVYAVLPKATGISNNAFYGCSKLQAVDAKVASSIGSGSFQNCTILSTLVLRPSNAIVTLGATSSLNGTRFASGGAGGTIYIPAVLYNHLGDGTALDYKAATNWSTIEGYGTITWAQIEGSIYETQYADGTAIPTT